MIDTEKLRELLAAAKELRDDLLMRGRRDEDGGIVVNASFGRWRRFNTAIDAMDTTKIGKNTLPALLDEVDRLSAENERLREALKRSDNLLRCFVRKEGAIVDAVRAQTRAALNKGKNDE